MLTHEWMRDELKDAKESIVAHGGSTWALAKIDNVLAALEEKPLAVVEGWMLDTDIKGIQRGCKPGQTMWIPLSHDSRHYKSQRTTVTVTRKP